MFRTLNLFLSKIPTLVWYFFVRIIGDQGTSVGHHLNLLYLAQPDGSHPSMHLIRNGMKYCRSS
jgi:hypothetical protein